MLAVTFDNVKRPVTQPEQLIKLCSVFRYENHSNRSTERNAHILSHKTLRHLKKISVYSFRESSDCTFILHSNGKDNEFIPTYPAKYCIIWHIFPDDPCKFDQYPVPHIMSVYIIYKLERVKIYDHKSAFLPGTKRTYLLVCIILVIKSRKLINCSLLFGTLHFPIGDKRNHYHDNKDSHNKSQKYNVKWNNISDFTADIRPLTSHNKIPSEIFHIFCCNVFRSFNALKYLILVPVPEHILIKPCVFDVNIFRINLNKTFCIHQIDLHPVLFFRFKKEALEVWHLNSDTAYTQKFSAIVHDPGIYEDRPLFLIHLIAVNVKVIGNIFIKEYGIPYVMLVINRINDFVKTVIGIITATVFGYQKCGIISKAVPYTWQVFAHGIYSLTLTHFVLILQKAYEKIITGHCFRHNDRLVKRVWDRLIDPVGQHCIKLPAVPVGKPSKRKDRYNNSKHKA